MITSIRTWPALLGISPFWIYLIYRQNSPAVSRTLLQTCNIFSKTLFVVCEVWIFFLCVFGLLAPDLIFYTFSCSRFSGFKGFQNMLLISPYPCYCKINLMIQISEFHSNWSYLLGNCVSFFSKSLNLLPLFFFACQLGYYA